MNKGIILYKSKYGATKKYAQWLQEMTGFECADVKQTDIKEVLNYDTIIFGGGVYASGIAGFSFVKKNIDALCKKKLVVFCAGASPYDEAAYNQMREMHFKDKLKEVPAFYCRGAWYMDKMSFVDSLYVRCLRRLLLNMILRRMSRGRKR